MILKLRLDILCAAFIIFAVSIYSPKAQAIDPRTKAVLTMAAYGTAGGALLGTASLAFGAKGRAVAVGASLGLYAGLIFGTYIVVNHRMELHRRYNPDSNYYPDSEGFSPYESGGGGWGDWFGGGEYWTPALNWSEAESDLRSYERIHSWGGQDISHPPIYLNLVQFQF